jgi:hypothetical protein
LAALSAENQGAGGLSGQGLRTDWLAIRAVTGEVRRYAHVPEVEVWLDLLGRRAVPAHENPVQQWGQPEPVIMATHRPFGKLGLAPPPRAPDLRAVAATTAAPVCHLTPDTGFSGTFDAAHSSEMSRGRRSAVCHVRKHQVDQGFSLTGHPPGTACHGGHSAAHHPRIKSAGEPLLGR